MECQAKQHSHTLSSPSFTLRNCWTNSLIKIENATNWRPINCLVQGKISIYVRWSIHWPDESWCLARYSGTTPLQGWKDKMNEVQWVDRHRCKCWTSTRCDQLQLVPSSCCARCHHRFSSISQLSYRSFFFFIFIIRNRIKGPCAVYTSLRNVLLLEVLAKFICRC